MPVLGSLLVLAGSGLAVLVLLVLAKLVEAERREPHNDVVGFVYAVVGVIYAVVLAMVVIGTWDTLDEARANTHAEADALVDLYWYGSSLGSPDGARIQLEVRQYTETVITQEWPLLARQSSSATALDEQMALRDLVYAQQPQNLGQQSRYQQALTAAKQVGDGRENRIGQAQDGVPRLLWAALYLGAAVTVGFAIGFGMRSLAAHCLLVFSVSLLVGSMLLLIYELNFPFAGGVRIGPDAFEMALERMNSVG